KEEKAKRQLAEQKERELAEARRFEININEATFTLLKILGKNNLQDDKISDHAVVAIDAIYSEQDWDAIKDQPSVTTLREELSRLAKEDIQFQQNLFHLLHPQNPDHPDYEIRAVL